MPERVGSLTAEAVLLPKRELLGTKVDFQARYSAAIERLGPEIVHRRDTSEPRDVLCMDERLKPLAPVTVRLAGPVPLLERTGRILKQKAEEGVVYGKVFDHDYCGALGLNMQALGPEMNLNPHKAGAKLARNFARDLTDASLGNKSVEYGGRLPLTRGPKERHEGQIIYYDARTAGLDPAHIEELEPGYVVSRGFFGKHAAREYAGLALNIAFGEHGLGSELTSDTPIHLVGITESQQDEGKIYDGLRWIQSSRGEDAARIKLHVITTHR